MNTPTTFRPALVLSLALVGLASACETPPDADDAPHDRTQGREDTLRDGGGSSGGGMWINNGLDDPDVSGIHPAFALTSEDGLSSSSRLLRDPARHDTVRYLVECALPAGRTITKWVDGQSMSFEGAVGLAPEWEDGECDEDCQEWVSACMLARTNVSGATVQIWMTADHPALGEGSHPAYPVYEASFFGNLFEGSQYYCQGGHSARAKLEGRTCTVDGSCGFVEYEACEREERCSYAQTDDGSASHDAVGCIGGSLDGGHAFHTINTYVGT